MSAPFVEHSTSGFCLAAIRLGMLFVLRHTVHVQSEVEAVRADVQVSKH